MLKTYTSLSVHIETDLNTTKELLRGGIASRDLAVSHPFFKNPGLDLRPPD